MQLDTGSDISIIDEKTWKAIEKPYLDSTRKGHSVFVAINLFSLDK